MATIEGFVIRVFLDTPIEVQGNKVNHLCAEIARALDMGGDFAWEVEYTIKNEAQQEASIKSITAHHIIEAPHDPN